MTFADLNLNTPLLRALEEMGFTTPTTIQRNVFPSQCPEEMYVALHKQVLVKHLPIYYPVCGYGSLQR